MRQMNATGWMHNCLRQVTASYLNPVLQQERYDPQMTFLRQWVPEVGTAKYPKPIVPHSEGRDNFLRAFGSTAAGREAIRAERREEAERSRKSRKPGRGGDTGRLF